MTLISQYESNKHIVLSYYCPHLYPGVLTKSLPYCPNS